MKRKNVPASDAEIEEKKADDVHRELAPVQNAKNSMSAKKRKLSKKDLLKPPTNEELNQLRETENLFHSNLFRLQIEEMFAEIKLKEVYVNLFNDWLSNVTNFLDGLENSEPAEISCGDWQKTLKVKLPIEKPDVKVEGVFMFVKPTAVKVFGSYEAGCCLGPNTTVDLLLLMPRKCFQRRDSLNHRYFHKRAMYLAYIASKLKKAKKLAEEIKFHYDQGNPLRPVIDVKPAGKLGKCFSVTIHLAPPSNCFKHNLFSPSKNNVRENWFFNLEDNADTSETFQGGPPTPHYNSSILVDLTVQENEEIRMSTLSDNNNMKDGIKLLKIWLHQRELDEGYGAFSAYIMSMYIVYLAKERRISNSMSSYQVVRTAWNCLAASDWTTNGLSLAQAMKVENSIPIKDFHKNFEVVFVDGTGFNNLCANMSRNTFIRVRKECQLAIKCLDNPNLNSFQALFMTKIPFYRQFDHMISFHNPESLDRAIKKYSSKADLLDHGNNLRSLALKLLLPKLSRAVQRRTKLLTEKLSPPVRWDISEAPSSSWSALAVGITLDPETAFDVIEKGPSANTPEAEEFRSFWGQKSELRRFQDGSVCEAVLWGDSNAKMSQRRTVCKKVVVYILKSMGLEEGSSWVYLSDQMESLVRRYGSGFVSVEEDCLEVIRATDRLSSNLRQLKGLPLDVTSVSGISPANRYSDPFSPMPSSLSFGKRGEKEEPAMEEHTLIGGEKMASCPWIPPVQVIIQLSVSSKWPNSLDAIRRVKAAFHVKIAESLEEKFKLRTQVYPEHLDVHQDGYVFRIHLSCPREISLLKESKDPDGMVKYKSTEESTELENRTIHLPKLSNSLHGLQQSFGAFGASCCLAKRWVASHLLLSDRHMPEICVELLVASLFLSPEPFTAPNQPQVAFLRFLELLATKDWSSQILILNLNDELSRQDIVSIENNFSGNERTSFPPLVIATPYDRTGDLWTKEHPSVQILVRLAHLASQTLQVVEGKLYTKSFVGFKQVFRPPLEPYDLVLHLYPQMLPRINEAVDPLLVKKDVNKDPPVSSVVMKGNLPPVAFDPVMFYLKELQDGYSDYALFFHDCYGGNFIGVLWKPVAFEEKDVKVSHFNSRKLNSQRSRLVVNFDAIVEDFYILGRGLVSNITVKFKSKE